MNYSIKIKLTLAYEGHKNMQSFENDLCNILSSGVNIQYW